MTATTQIALLIPAASATRPETIAPAAKPRSRQRRYAPTADPRHDGSATSATVWAGAQDIPRITAPRQISAADTFQLVQADLNALGRAQHGGEFLGAECECVGGAGFLGLQPGVELFHRLDCAGIRFRKILLQLFVFD